MIKMIHMENTRVVRSE